MIFDLINDQKSAVENDHIEISKYINMMMINDQ